MGDRFRYGEEEEAGSGSGIRGLVQKPKAFDSRSRGQHGQGHRGKCGKTHNEVCKVGGSCCYKYRKSSHYNRDCTATTQVSGLICFHCNHRRHKKANCPSLTAREITTPAPTTLRMTDDRLGKAEAPIVRSVSQGGSCNT